MSYDCCPECGETNYAEEWCYSSKLDVYAWIKTFDCGFQGAEWNRNGYWNTARRTACGDAEVKRKAQKKSNGYRLALYDAANLVELLAEELHKAQQEGARKNKPDLKRHIRMAESICAEMRRYAGGGQAYIAEKAAPSGAPSAPISTLIEYMKKRADKNKI